jgi:hypothetical protein
MGASVSKPVRFFFDREKALEVILYIAKRSSISDKYHIVKILFLADKKHLSKYGRFICGDHYVKMEYGPTPSGTYDIVKRKNKEFKCEGDRLIPNRDAYMDYLSESDKECLDDAIATIGAESFDGVHNISQDEAFQETQGRDIPVEKIAKFLPNADEVLEYLHEYY